MQEYVFQEQIAEEIARERCARRVLGVSGEDGPERIKKAFRLLAMRHHPDRTPGGGDSERTFREIVLAYEYLNKGAERGYARRGEEEGSPCGGSAARGGGAWGYYLWWQERYFDEGAPAPRGRVRAGDYASAGWRDDPARYEGWYASPDGARIDAEEKSSLSRLLGPGGGARLLEVGCGTGHFTGWFAEQGYRAFGIDRSGALIRHAAGRSAASFAVADGCALPFADRSFHTVAAIAVLEFVGRPERMLLEMRRVADRRVLLLMLNPSSGLNRARRRRRRGAFASARLRTPGGAARLLRGAVPPAAGDSLRREVHGDFHLLLLESAAGGRA